MIRADETLLRALMNLEGNADFETFLQWMRDSYNSMSSEMIFLEKDIETRWAQGSLQTLDEILDIVHNKRKKLDTLKEGHRIPGPFKSRP